MRQNDRPALDGLRQEKFNLNLPTDWICFVLKSARGISQSTVLSWRKPVALSILNCDKLWQKSDQSLVFFGVFLGCFFFQFIQRSEPAGGKAPSTPTLFVGL